MAEFTRELFLQALDDWARYPVSFRSLALQEQADFLKRQGYASVQELLTHVAAWWEEGRGIIADTIRNSDTGGRQYDLDAFNAAALEKHRGTSDAQFAAWYEAERGRMVALVGGLSAEQLAVRRVRNWLNAVVLQHLKEHGLSAPRYLVVDMLHREWADFQAGFVALRPDDQSTYMKQQGFARFRDVVAHILAGWEQGISVIQADSAEDPFGDESDDDFNARAIARYGKEEESHVSRLFEETRLMLANLVDMLPDEILNRPNVQKYLKADVLDHYYEHSL